MLQNLRHETRFGRWANANETAVIQKVAREQFQCAEPVDPQLALSFTGKSMLSQAFKMLWNLLRLRPTTASKVKALAPGEKLDAFVLLKTTDQSELPLLEETKGQFLFRHTPGKRKFFFGSPDTWMQYVDYATVAPGERLLHYKLFSKAGSPY